MIQAEAKKICGIVMPISAIDGCSEGHWSDVLEIITEAIEQANFEANLVSNADDVGIIQKRIIQNLYENPIVVCDVSAKNPNVMFELGMRLAFDKPTIIVKDDKTTYSFDTSPIEHIEYPRDLRFSRIIDFKQKLADKIKGTHEKSINDNNYTTFLKHFGEFKVAKIDKKEVSSQEFILEELKNIRIGMRRLERNSSYRESFREFHENEISDNELDYCLAESSPSEIKKAIEFLKGHPAVVSTRTIDFSPNHRHIRAKLVDAKYRSELHDLMKTIFPKTSNRHDPIAKE